MLLAQGISLPQMVAMGAALVLGPLYMWFFTFRLGMGLAGPALGLVAMQATALAALATYVMLRDQTQQTWGGWWVTRIAILTPTG